MSALYDRVGLETSCAMNKAMMDAMAQGRNVEPDFGRLEFAAAWEYLHWFRGAGKESAYGPLQQAINDDANSHALRGFLVGWAMCEAMHAESPCRQLSP